MKVISFIRYLRLSVLNYPFFFTILPVYSIITSGKVYIYIKSAHFRALLAHVK